MCARTIASEKVSSAESHRAFSLLELIVVVAVIGLLGLTVVPALTRTRPGSEGIQCLNNSRRLVAAWQMYALDYGDRMVTAHHGGDFSSPSGLTWAGGWLDWSTSTDNTNIVLVQSPRYALLGPYLSETRDAIRCPADRHVSLAQVARGWTSRTRSRSINIGLGIGNAEVGPWDPMYRHLTKTSEFQIPTPAETWVCVDEHPDSINDGAFFSPYRTSWVDQPATYHNGGAGLAFADGRSEIHKWTGSLRRLRGVGFNFTSLSVGAGDTDIHWMSYHAQRKTSASY